ncbi:hypothetical protein B0A49_08583 [Cryomyces minteri]|uniref:Uncharacterized protein n=1 Tax=Cryomyces minteri TaxID=331657 RepID=A0A4U0WKV0_9PEZI|nr:hypothetical protein B0A49_08583 [Cryomyces minteri]
MEACGGWVLARSSSSSSSSSSKEAEPFYPTRAAHAIFGATTADRDASKSRRAFRRPRRAAPCLCEQLAHTTRALVISDVLRLDPLPIWSRLCRVSDIFQVRPSAKLHRNNDIEETSTSLIRGRSTLTRSRAAASDPRCADLNRHALRSWSDPPSNTPATTTTDSYTTVDDRMCNSVAQEQRKIEKDWRILRWF